jgi:hypothetical protein
LLVILGAQPLTAQGVSGVRFAGAVLSRRTSALLHLTICFPESDGAANHTSGNKNNQQFPPLTSKIPIQAVMEVVLAERAGTSFLRCSLITNHPNGRRVSVHWFTGVLQSLCSLS